MWSEGTQKEMVVTQVSFGGFDKYVSAKELTEFLENEESSISVFIQSQCVKLICARKPRPEARGGKPRPDCIDRLY